MRYISLTSLKKKSITTSICSSFKIIERQETQRNQEDVTKKFTLAKIFLVLASFYFMNFLFKNLNILGDIKPSTVIKPIYSL